MLWNTLIYILSSQKAPLIVIDYVVGVNDYNSSVGLNCLLCNVVYPRPPYNFYCTVNLTAHYCHLTIWDFINFHITSYIYEPYHNYSPIKNPNTIAMGDRAKKKQKSSSSIEADVVDNAVRHHPHRRHHRTQCTTYSPVWNNRRNLLSILSIEKY